MNTFTIKDLENLSGIKAHTIRVWEQRYSFLRPQRTETNIRYYSNEELKMILNVALLTRYGFKISHIDRMSPEEISQKLMLLNDSQAQQERMVNELVKSMVDLDIAHFEDSLDRFISTRGIDKTINQLIFPFLEKIGILWQTNHVIPAQEHLVSNLIRQKLIVGIEKAGSSLKLDRLYLLFLPEGEYHELGILYVYYLLKSRGASVLYLGANVPLKDVEFVVRHKKPDEIYSHITCTHTLPKVEKFMEQLHQSCPDTPLVISGTLARSGSRQLPSGIQFKHSLSDVLSHFSSI